MNDWTIHPNVSIGHVHLKVSDLVQSLAFYNGILGFEIMQRHGDEVAFLSAGGYHHHIALNTWESRGGSPPLASHTGLFHVAIRYPNRRELARTLQRLIDHEVPIWGALDHGATEAVYLNDPDSNGVELCWDRPREEWPWHNGQLAMGSAPVNIANILAELDRELEPVGTSLSLYPNYQPA